MLSLFLSYSILKNGSWKTSHYYSLVGPHPNGSNKSPNMMICSNFFLSYSILKNSSWKTSHSHSLVGPHSNGSNKSPGGDDIVFILLNSKKLLEKINYTAIAVIPLVRNPKKITDSSLQKHSVCKKINK